MEKRKVIARSNLPATIRAPAVALLYFVYSKLYNFSAILDWAVIGLLCVWFIAEVVAFASQYPVDIFESEKEEE